MISISFVFHFSTSSFILFLNAVESTTTCEDCKLIAEMYPSINADTALYSSLPTIISASVIELIDSFKNSVLSPFVIF